MNKASGVIDRDRSRCKPKLSSNQGPISQAQNEPIVPASKSRISRHEREATSTPRWAESDCWTWFELG